MDTLLNLPSETGEFPPERIRDAASAHAIFSALVEADRASAENRAKIQAMMDGEPPYDQAELNRLGQGYRCNLNFGEAAAALDAAAAGYLDLTNSVDFMALCQTSYGPPELRAEYDRVLSEEIHRTIKEWSDFELMFQLNVHHFLKDGVSAVFWDHDKDWRWKAVGLGDFLVPRGVGCSEAEQEIVCIRSSYQLHQLARYVADESAACAVGWNVPAVRKAMLSATGKSPNFEEWEKFQEALKSNDLHESYARQAVVRVVHYYVQELDGQVSHYIGLQDSPDEFLYRRRFKYKYPESFFNLYCYGVGNNGKLHTIRGLGYKIFPHVQISNRLNSQVVDSTILSSSLMLQPNTAEDMRNLSLIYQGPLAYLPPNTRIVEGRLSNPSQFVLPVLNYLSMHLQNNTGQYNQRGVSSDGQERTKFEVQAQLQKESVLSTAATNLFYNPWGKTLREMVRRMQRADYRADEPGGRAVVELKARLLRRGVPLEAFYSIDRVSPVRSVGYGSPQMRLLVNDEIMSLVGMLPESGRYNALRDRIAARVGYDAVDRYVPRPAAPTTVPVESKIAILENSALRTGQEIPVSPNENAGVHMEAHVPEIMALWQAWQQGQIPVEQAVMQLRPLLAHAFGHLQVLAMDSSRAAQVKELNREFQKLGSQLESAAHGLAARAAQNQNPVDVEQQAKLLKLQLEAAETQQRMELERAETLQKLALRDQEMAAKVRQKNHI